MPETQCVIVGGGLAGLACARELSARGRELLLLEASDGFGGRVRTDKLEGFRAGVDDYLVKPLTSALSTPAPSSGATAASSASRIPSGRPSPQYESSSQPA